MLCLFSWLNPSTWLYQNSNFVVSFPLERHFLPFFGLTVLFFCPVEVVTLCEWACLAEAQVSVRVGWHTNEEVLVREEDWVQEFECITPDLCLWFQRYSAHCCLIHLFSNSEFPWNQREGESRKGRSSPISHPCLAFPTSPAGSSLFSAHTEGLLGPMLRYGRGVEAIGGTFLSLQISLLLQEQICLHPFVCG